MTKYFAILMILCYFHVVMHSQVCPDIFEPLTNTLYQNEWEENINSMVEKEYQIYDKSKKNTKVDTAFTMNNTDLKFSIINKIQGKKIGNQIIKDSDSLGTKIKETIVLNKKNQISKKSKEYIDKKIISQTYYEYNDSGKITKFIVRKCTTCDSTGMLILYNQDQTIQKITNIFGFGNYVFEGLKVPKATLYDSKVEDSMISKDIIDKSKVKLRDSNYRYLVTPLANNMMKYEALMKSKDTFRYAMMWRKIRDVNNQLLAEEGYNGKEKIVNKKYGYTPKGRLKSFGDLITNESFSNTYNADGKPLEEKDLNFINTKYYYDQKGNWIKKEIYSKSGSLISFVTRLISYY